MAFFQAAPIFETLERISSLLSLPIVGIALVFFIVGGIILLLAYRRRRSLQTILLALFMFFAAGGIFFLILELGVGVILGDLETYGQATGIDVVIGTLTQTRTFDITWFFAMVAIFCSSIAMAIQAAFAISFLPRRWMWFEIVPIILSLTHWVVHSWTSVFWWQRPGTSLIYDMNRDPFVEGIIVALMVVPLLSGPVFLGYAAYGARLQSQLAFRRALLMTILQAMLAVTYFFKLFELPT